MTEASVLERLPEVTKAFNEGHSKGNAKYYTALPRDFYLSPELFEKEYERVFSRQWIFAGHVSELAKVGDYFLKEFAGESVIVVRDAEDHVSAFLNVCRHRGHELCKAATGTVRNFMCPYHQWTFQLDGKLKRAPGMPDGECFDYKDWGLHKVHVEDWEGLIFVWLGKETPPTLASKLGAPDDDVLKLEPRKMREAFRETLKFDANWKLLLENYLECYHCAGSHPELGIAMDLQAMYAGTDDWQSEYFLGILPLKQGASTISSDGNLVCSPLGLFGKGDVVPEGFGAGFGVVPTLTRVIFHVDHAVVHAMNPVNVNEVEWETRWYVRDDAVEGKDYDLTKLTEVWRATNMEDKFLCEGAMKGVRSRRFEPGPLNPKSESAIPSAVRVYLALMNDNA